MQPVLQDLVDRKPPPQAQTIPLSTWAQSPRQTEPQCPGDDIDKSGQPTQRHLTVFGWNPGGERKLPTMIKDMLFGSFHILLIEEAHGLVEIHEEFFIIISDMSSNLAVCFRKTTFVEPDSDCKNVISVPSLSSKSWGCVALCVTAELRRPWHYDRAASPVKFITAAAVHFHNVDAKKRGQSPISLATLFKKLEEVDVDIIHGDFNMAASSGVLKNATPRNYLPNHDNDVLWGMPKVAGDCCGFLLREGFGSKFIPNAIVERHGTWDFNQVEVLGLKKRDAGTHWCSFIHFVATAASRTDRRGQVGAKHRNQRAGNRRERKAAKRAYPGASV